MAAARDDEAFPTPIIPGDLGMREVLNWKSKLHPCWDGPFVVLEVSDMDTYQLATANGYVIRNLVNDARLRRLDAQERTFYANEFWDSSSRLRSHDAKAEHEKQLHEVNMRLKHATVDLLEAQKKNQEQSRDPDAYPSVPKLMDKIGSLNTEKLELEAHLRRAKVALESSTEDGPEVVKPGTQGKRVRKPSRRMLGL